MSARQLRRWQRQQEHTWTARKRHTPRPARAYQARDHRTGARP